MRLVRVVLQAAGCDPSPGTCRRKAECLDKEERVIQQFVWVGGWVADRKQLEECSRAHILNVIRAVAIIAVVVVDTLQNRRRGD